MQSDIALRPLALHTSWSTVQVCLCMMLVIAWSCNGALKPMSAMSPGCSLVDVYAENPHTLLCIAVFNLLEVAEASCASSWMCYVGRSSQRPLYAIN